MNDTNSTETPSAEATASAARSPALAVPKGLVMKLAEVMGAVDRIPKNGKNEHFGYRFATEADVSDVVRGELAKRHVLAVPHVDNVQWGEVPRKSGGVEKLCTLKGHYEFIDGETGEVLSMPLWGQGIDAGDKAIYKATTGAVKYALMKLFLISTGDDPEHEAKQPSQTSSSGGRSPVRSASRSTPAAHARSVPPAAPVAAQGHARADSRAAALPAASKGVEPVPVVHFARPGEPGGPPAPRPSGPTVPAATSATVELPSSGKGPPHDLPGARERFLSLLDAAKTGSEVMSAAKFGVLHLTKATRDDLRPAFDQAFARVGGKQRPGGRR